MTKIKKSKVILKMKCLYSCFFLLLISNNAFATEQSMDILIYNDSVSYLFSENLVTDSPPIRGYPLEYFIWREPNDTIAWKVKREMLKSYRWCMRGYIAKWEIRSDSLFLIEISYFPTVTAYVQGRPADSFPLERLFPDRNVTNGVFADWFSGRVFTVMYHSNYPPISDDYWENKRKTFGIIDGKLIGVRRW